MPPELSSSSCWLSPYRYRPATEIPPRRWLYGGHYIRRFISTTIAPPGTGKSALAVVEALAMATAKPLLGVQPLERLRVAYWNGEDPLEETERRIAAAIKQYGLDGRDLEGWLFWGSGRDDTIILAEMTSKGVAIVDPMVERVITAARHMDVLIVDPFVSAHRVPENDNGAIDLVAKKWAHIADVCDIAVELVHHPRKGTPGQDFGVEDGRGASALLAAARSARVLNVMSEQEADAAGVERRRRRAHFRSEIGKANLAPPPEKATWYRFVSIDLENAEEGLGDSVGVVTAWPWPDPFEGVSAADTFRVQEAVQAGSWRENVQARDWVGIAVAQALRLDLTNTSHKAKVKGLLKTWFATGVLAVEERDDSNREKRKFVVVGNWVTP